MSLLKRSGEGLLLGALIFLLFFVVFENRIQLPGWLHVAGRMHPMFLHFPIVLLLIYLFALWLPRRVTEEWIEPLSLVAALSAVITALMGFILSLEEVQEGNSFSLHKWGGIGIAIVAAGFHYGQQTFSRTKFITRPLTLAAALLIFLTGHWGANLTHGENYLFEPYAGAEVAVAFDQAYAFNDVVQPVLEAKCGNCHNASNKKGGLSLSDTASVLEGGKGGALFIAGRPDSSMLMQRILLPLHHKKHMAPKAKPQLTEEEIELLHAWVKAGAPLHKKVMDLPLIDSFRLLAARYLSPSGGGQMAYDFPPAEEATIKALNTDYRVVTPLGSGSPALAVQFYGRSGYSAKSLEELLQIKNQITELNLAKLPVKDEDLQFVKQLPNLQKLNLNNTDVTDKGVLQLAGLKRLRELALSGTAVSVASLEKMAKLPELYAIYIWNTKLDSAKTAALQKGHKNIRFETGYLGAKDTTVYTLNAPTIKTPEGIFDATTLLEVKHGIKGVEIRYTLDGSEPDSIKAAIYTGPVRLDSSATLKVKAFKQGWSSSSVAQRNYIQKGIKVDSILLVSAADSSFNPGNPRVLIDDVVGNPASFRNKKWYGFKKNEGIYILSFDKPTTVSEVWMILLKDIASSSIFPAAEIEVWGGMDKQSWKPLSKKKTNMPTGYESAGLVQSKVSFTPASVKHLKLVLHPLKKIPDWHYSKGKPSVALVSEIVVH
jgi:mono/diheme cytochrome c family protein